jgi:membrane protease YdiL (CAAX protease family)
VRPPEQPLSANDARLPLGRWLLAIFGLWIAAHALNRWLRITTEQTPPGLRLAWWTCAKLIAWFLPTFIVVCRAKGRSAGRWLGFTSDRAGLGVGLFWCAAWLAFELTGAALHLPLFQAPPSRVRVEDLPGALLLAPLFEELMFRGFMLRALRERGIGRDRAVLASALAFAALHLPGWLVHRGLDLGIVGACAGIAFFGAVLGYLAWRTASLWPAILLHVTNNALSTGVLGWLVRALLG